MAWFESLVFVYVFCIVFFLLYNAIILYTVYKAVHFGLIFYLDLEKNENKKSNIFLEGFNIVLCVRRKIKKNSMKQKKTREENNNSYSIAVVKLNWNELKLTTIIYKIKIIIIIIIVLNNEK